MIFQLMPRTRNGPAPIVTFLSEMHCRAMDISYIWTGEGWLYLAFAHALGPMALMRSLLDLHSRRVIGWAPLGRFCCAKSPAGQWVSDRMKRDLAIRALHPFVTFRAEMHYRAMEGDQPASAAAGLHPSHRSRRAVLLP